MNFDHFRLLRVATRNQARMADFKADSMFESARLNLLEVIEERNRALNKVGYYVTSSDLLTFLYIYHLL